MSTTETKEWIRNNAGLNHLNGTSDGRFLLTETELASVIELRLANLMELLWDAERILSDFSNGTFYSGKPLLTTREEARNWLLEYKNKQREAGRTA